jgi:hypothetical protein
MQRSQSSPTRDWESKSPDVHPTAALSTSPLGVVVVNVPTPEAPLSPGDHNGLRRTRSVKFSSVHPAHTDGRDDIMMHEADQSDMETHASSGRKVGPPVPTEAWLSVAEGASSPPTSFRPGKVMRRGGTGAASSHHHMPTRSMSPDQEDSWVQPDAPVSRAPQRVQARSLYPPIMAVVSHHYDVPGGTQTLEPPSEDEIDVSPRRVPRLKTRQSSELELVADPHTTRFWSEVPQHAVTALSPYSTGFSPRTTISKTKAVRNTPRTGLSSNGSPEHVTRVVSSRTLPTVGVPAVGAFTSSVLQQWDAARR